MDVQEIGRRLRTLRVAAGRTVASVAVDAGLSVPYVANLENGRGNPTLSALSRLASALGTELRASFEPLDDGRRVPSPTPADIPAPLVRLGRKDRFQGQAHVMADSLGIEPDELSARMLGCLALAGAVLGRDLTESDYWRLVDALTVIAVTQAADAGDH